PASPKWAQAGSAVDRCCVWWVIMSRCWIASFALLTAVAACSSGGKAKPDAAGTTTPPVDGGAGMGVDMGPLPFQVDPPAVYLAKVKNLLVGLPPTADEV